MLLFLLFVVLSVDLSDTIGDIFLLDKLQEVVRWDELCHRITCSFVTPEDYDEGACLEVEAVHELSTALTAACYEFLVHILEGLNPSDLSNVLKVFFVYNKLD